MAPYRKNPDWPKETTNSLDNHTNTFSSDLKKIASSLARHDKADNVDRNHVDRAFHIMRWHGLSKRPLMKRPEFFVSIGGLLLGTAGFYTDAAPYYIGQDAADKIGWMVVTILLILSALFIFFGWLSGRFGSEHLT